MAYILVESFSGGVDRSRPRYVGPAGTLWSGINGHLTRGGDFEKRKEFAVHLNLPAGTFGMAKTADGLYTFGSAADPGVPAGITYMRLEHPTDAARTMTKVLSWDLFAGLLYVIAKYDNGDVRHFYDGAHVDDWNAGGTNPTGYGSIAKTHRRKVYSPVGSILWFSELDVGNVFDTAESGSGFQNMSNHHSGSDVVRAMTTYNELLAIMSRRVIQIWDMQDDDANNAPFQTLTETGTRSPRSVQGFGDVDAFYLSDSGVRSLRARSGTNLAGVNDVGTPIDPLIREYIGTLTDAQVEDACSTVEPVDGRYWLALGGRIFVFSYFPTKKISAWSWYEPGFDITDLVTLNDRVYARAGDVIYLYGGASNDSYGSDYDVTAALPFLSGGKPGTFKNLNGMDLASTGTWNCKVLVDPNDEAQYIDVGDLQGVTWFDDGIGVPGHCTHISPVLVHRGAGQASVSQIGIHTDGAEEKM